MKSEIMEPEFYDLEWTEQVILISLHFELKSSYDWLESVRDDFRHMWE